MAPVTGAAPAGTASPSVPALTNVHAGDTVLVTGGTGSLGMALAASLAKVGAKVRIFSRDELKQLEMHRRYPDFDYRLGDVRDPVAVRDAIRGVSVVIHGASLKYVDVSERQPSEYVHTNVVGTMNVIAAVLDSITVRRCVGISTDKAAAPVNCYGLTKALTEKLFVEAALRRPALPLHPSEEGIERTTGPIFTVCRYGNVVGTRGSVVPAWAERRRRGLPLLVTDPTMTRFFFTLDEAVELIDFALGRGPGVVVSKRMAAASLSAVASVMMVNGLEVVGARPGEKRHEVLLTEDEMRRTTSIEDKLMYLPLLRPVENSEGAYTSDKAPQLSTEDLRKLLAEYLA